jgi:hypothetical protein
MRTRALVTPLAAAMILVAAPRRAEACSCVKPPAPKQALADSAAVFEGKVVGLGRDPAKHRLTATFAVTRWWKGGEAARVAVATIDVDSMCGVGFAEGDEWLVYAGGDATGLSASLCSRTRRAAEAEADRKALGAGKSPTPGSASGDPPATGPTNAETKAGEGETKVGDAPAAEDPGAGDTPALASGGDVQGSEPPASTAPPATEAKPATAGCTLTGEPMGGGLVGLVFLVGRRRGRRAAR